MNAELIVGWCRRNHSSLRKLIQQNAAAGIRPAVGLIRQAVALGVVTPGAMPHKEIAKTLRLVRHSKTPLQRSFL